LKALMKFTLAHLLFAGASTVSLQQVREDAQLPLRLLTIASGTLVGLGLPLQEGLALAALLGAILAPTDGALGRPRLACCS
jgi:NhaP-type Na+/H+ or K+/H+ antiporter